MKTRVRTRGGGMVSFLIVLLLLVMASLTVARALGTSIAQTIDGEVTQGVGSIPIPRPPSGPSE